MQVMKIIRLSDDKPFHRNRVVVKKGREYQTVRLEDVVCFYSAYKIIFLYDRESHKYITEKKKTCANWNRNYPPIYFTGKTGNTSSTSII